MYYVGIFNIENKWSYIYLETKCNYEQQLCVVYICLRLSTIVVYRSPGYKLYAFFNLICF